ncbi:hypothetical protein C2142_20455 [Streptomyces sp. CB01881]|nr:hypothetical protein C2142_20455 [Streptomyces sp. CB01881]
MTHLSMVRALLQAPLGPGLRTSRGCGQAAGLLFKGEGRTGGRLALTWAACQAYTWQGRFTVPVIM